MPLNHFRPINRGIAQSFVLHYFCVSKFLKNKWILTFWCQTSQNQLRQEVHSAVGLSSLASHLTWISYHPVPAMKIASRRILDILEFLYLWATIFQWMKHKTQEVGLALKTIYLYQQLLRSNNILGINKTAVFSTFCVVHIICPGQKYKSYKVEKLRQYCCGTLHNITLVNNEISTM